MLSATVGSIGHNRLGSWYSYRAAKAALDMLIKTAAIEVARNRKNSELVAAPPGRVQLRLAWLSGVRRMMPPRACGANSTRLRPPIAVRSDRTTVPKCPGSPVRIGPVSAKLPAQMRCASARPVNLAYSTVPPSICQATVWLLAGVLIQSRGSTTGSRAAATGRP